MSGAEIMRDVAYTIDCLSIEDDIDDLSNFEKSNGYWTGIETCRGIADANAAYVRNFIEDALTIGDDGQVFVLDLLSRLVEAYRMRRYEKL